MSEAAKPLRVLIVENHPDTVKWLQILLEDMGHSVVTARTITEAQTALAVNECCDVMISDIGLPDGTGWELLERGFHKRPLYAIAMSGFGMNADMARSKAAGFRHHILKPFRTEELEKILADAASELESVR
jgi:CheY-like chemotaxis protein